MVEIGPNLTTILLALVGILSLVVTNYLSQRHAETTQKQSNGIAAEVIQAQTLASQAHKTVSEEVPNEPSRPL
jgi:hypothetical protein